jgi:hypothetical protein
MERIDNKFQNNGNKYKVVLGLNVVFSNGNAPLGSIGEKCKQL